MDSSAAFALTRAVEYHNKSIEFEELFKETYIESFNRSGIFAISNVSNKNIYKSSTLLNELNSIKKISIPELSTTRRSRVYQFLKNINDPSLLTIKNNGYVKSRYLRAFI